MIKMKMSYPKWIEVVRFIHNSNRKKLNVRSICRGSHITLTYTNKIVNDLLDKNIVKRIAINKKEFNIILTKKGNELAYHCDKVIQLIQKI